VLNSSQARCRSRSLMRRKATSVLSNESMDKTIFKFAKQDYGTGVRF
jgi:hypothetical protein